MKTQQRAKPSQGNFRSGLGQGPRQRTNGPSAVARQVEPAGNLVRQLTVTPGAPSQPTAWLGAQQVLGNRWVNQRLSQGGIVQREDDSSGNIDPLEDAVPAGDTTAADTAAADTAAADTAWYEDILSFTGDQAAIALRRGLPEGILRQQTEAYLTRYANQGQTYLNELIDDAVGLSDLKDARQGDFWQRHTKTVLEPLYDLAEGLLLDQINQLMEIVDPAVIETVQEWSEDPWAAMGLLAGAAVLAYLANMGFPVSARQTLGAGFSAELQGAIAPLQEMAIEQMTLAISHSSGVSLAGYVNVADSGNTYGGRLSYKDDGVSASLDVSGTPTEAQHDETGALIRDSQTTVGVTGAVQVEGDDYAVGATATVKKSEDSLVIEIPKAALSLDDVNLSGSVRYKSGANDEGLHADATVTFGDKEKSHVTGTYSHRRDTTQTDAGTTTTGQDDMAVGGRYQIDDQSSVSGSVGANYDVTSGNWTGRTNVTLSIDGHDVTVSGTVEFADQNVVTIKVDYNMLESVLYSVNVKAGDKTGVMSAGTRLEVKDLGGLVDNLDVYGYLEAGNLDQVGAGTINQAVIGANYSQDLSLFGTDFEAIVGVEGGQMAAGLDQEGKAVNAGQVNFNVGFKF